MTAIEAIDAAIVDLRRKLRLAVGKEMRERLTGEIEGLRKAKVFIIDERYGLL